MRSARFLLLAAILVIVAAVGGTYFYRKELQARRAPRPPAVLPLNTDAVATDWEWSKAGKNPVYVRAKLFSQVNNPPRAEIKKVEMKLFHKGGTEFDLVKSASAQFDLGQGMLYSDGEVEIAMAVPVEGPPRGRLVNIRSSGVSFDSKSNRVWTTRPASFTFDQGTGKAVGASYDPTARQLVLNNAVELNWRGHTADSDPMKIEAAQLIYREGESRIVLPGWCKLTRGSTVLESQSAVVFLADGAIDRVQTAQAHGTDALPNRNIQYAADRLFLKFTERGEIENVAGESNAHLVAAGPTGRTEMHSDRVDLAFELSSGTSELKNAVARGHSRVESVPVARPGTPPPATRVLTSEVIQMVMRPGGKDLQAVLTHTPGSVDFLPNRPGDRRRHLEGDRLWMGYGPDNRLETFHATQASTRTERERKKGDKQDPPPMLTWSKDLQANFDPKTGQLARLRQWNDFRYQEGDRQARAQEAVLEEGQHLITLDKAARVWDPTGSTSADRIQINQQTNETAAAGNVVSTHLPDRKGKSGTMLSQDDPMEGRAERMTTADHNRKVHYEGGAQVWQGANRIRADIIDIDRIAQRLDAKGNVHTQFVDRPKQEVGQPVAPQRAPGFVLVDAARMVYTDKDRLAHYSGGSHLVKAGLDVRSDEIRAYLNDSQSDSSLDRAFADGSVRLVRSQAGRTRTGTSEHAEYYTKDERIVLTGGEPVLTDSLRGTTRGSELTYYPNEDRLLVNGAAAQPVVTRINRKSSP